MKHAGDGHRTMVVLAASLVVGILGVSSAADARPLDSWHGFYVGAHAGSLGGSVNLTETSGPGDPRGAISGFIGGPLAGYAFTPATLAFAIEGDLGFGSVNGTGLFLPPVVITTEEYFYHLTWNAHLRGLVGLPGGGPITPFLAGGLAFADFNVTEESSPGITGAVYTGFTVGGGLNAEFSPTVTGRAEVLYDDYGNRTYDDFSVHLTTWTARVALIFRLGS
jgi:outer membrane immunogenic protein